ncbi:unnamed protein product [Paramecium pentaurelia]|uniref:Uncharacterized protein n=1 Tax=Paramecium pentaurelia TaxID=43138 RepID=A0A8S1X0A3_9CILI|nr:unnamed protein product [Paramecium pentaurelia]
MFNQYLKLLHIQWESKIIDYISDSLKDDLKQSLQNQSIMESKFISKSKSQNQQEYESIFQQQRESPFFSTYLIIHSVIKEYYAQTENILNELSTTINISNIFSQQIIIEQVIYCMDNLLYEYDKLPEINENVKQVLYEVFYEIGGNIIQFIKNIIQNNDHQHQQYKYIKAFINLQRLIKLIISFNFKKKQETINLIYQILLGNTLYFTYLKDIEIQNFLQIFEIFQQCYLQNEMQLQELSNVEQFQEISFCQIYLSCLKQNYQQMQYIQFIQSNSCKWIDQINQLNDINYYLIFIYLIQITEFVDNIKFDIKIIPFRNQQIITLIQQKNYRIVETKLSYYNIIGEQLLQINNNNIINSYLDIHIQELKEFINDNNINTQQLIKFIQYLCQYYPLFNEEQKIEFNSSLIQFFTQEIKEQQYSKIFDLKILENIENEQIYKQIIDIAISNSSKSLQHSYGFLNFIQKSIQLNSKSFKHILRYITILMRSCKKNKQGVYKNKISYKKGKGTYILNYLYLNLRYFVSLVKNIYDFIIKSSNKSVEQHQIYVEIYHKITYIIYMIFWLTDDKYIINLDEIQQICVELCQIHYKFTINLIIILQYNGNLETNILYQIINNINAIAYGQDYIIYIKDNYFDKDENLLNNSNLYTQLNQRKIQMKLVFNQFYETSISILFEVPNILIDRKFYLQILKFQLKTQISLILSFQDFCPKFIFYFRLERDPEIINLMQQCIIIVISLNQDPQIIKQLFESLSQHQSTILMNDLNDLQIDANDQDQIQLGYRLVNLQPYRIPLFQQSSHLIKLVEDKNYYTKVFKIILETFQSVYQKWQQISQQEQSNHLYFQGGESSIQMNFTPIPIQIIQVLMKLKLNIQENEDDNLQDLDEIKFGSFIDNFEQTEKLILFTLEFTKNQEIQIAINQQTFFIIYKQDETYQEQDYQTNLDLSQWFNLDFQIKNNQYLILKINEQIFNFQLKSQQNQQLQFYKFILGIKLNDNIWIQNEQNNYYQIQYNNSLNLMSQYSFEGHVSEFNLIINKYKIQFEQTNKINIQKQTINFINTGVIRENVYKFDDIFLITPYMHNQFNTYLQNVYILNMKQGINFIQQCGGVNIFYMILDLLYDLCKNKNVSDYEEIIMLILDLFKENIQFQNNLFNSQNLQYLEDNCKRWIQNNERISNEFINKLMSIYNIIKNEQAQIQYLITIIKILDNKFTTLEQIKIICTKSVLQNLINQNCLNELINIHLYFESRYIFTLVSLKKSQEFIDIEAINLQPYSLVNCIQYQGIVQIADINSISKIFNLILIQQSFNLFTLDILQIIDILIGERMKQKIKLKDEEEEDLNIYKNIIIQILDKYQKLYITNQIYFYELEVFDKLNELTFSIYFSIVQQLRYNYKEDGELNQLQIYYDYISHKQQTVIGYCLISKILSLIKYFEEDIQLVNQLLRFINQLYQYQLINDSINEKIIIWFLDQFKNIVLRKQQSDILLMNLIKLQNYTLLIKHLMTTSINKNQNISDLFTYCIIYLIELYSNFTIEILYQIHIQSQIINNDSFNLYLQAIYPTIIQFYALKQVQQFQVKEDGSKLINIIIIYLHIEQCIGEIQNLESINWDKYSQIMDKGIDLFNYLDILFYDHNFFLPCIEDTFTLQQIKEDYDKLRKQNNRLLPNGGIKRLMIQLIAPFVKIPQMKKPIKNYLSINQYSIEGRIDQQSCQRIKLLIDEEFSVPLLQTRKQYKKNLTELLYHQDNYKEQMKKKEKKSKLINHSKFYQLLIYYFLLQDNSLNKIDKQELKNQNEIQEIFKKYQLTKFIKWKMVDHNLIECLIYKEKAQKQIFIAFNQLNKLKKQTLQNQISINNTYDLSQIDSIDDELANIIKLSIFMDIQIYYEFIHKLWLLYPRIIDPLVIPRTQSNLLVDSKLLDISQFRDIYKQDLRTKNLDQEERQQLLFIVEDQLQILQQELNKFITHKQFKFEVLESMQLKKIEYSEDMTRKRPYLKITKIIQFYNSYLETPNQVGKLIKRTNTISSIKKEQLIQYKLNYAFNNIKKGQSDKNQLGITKYYCEYITQEGAYQGFLRFNETNQCIQFQQEELEFQELFSSPEVIQTTEDLFLQISLAQIINIYPRRFLLMEIAIEIFINRQNYFFNLFTNQEQQELLQKFKKKQVQVIDPIEEFKKMNYQQKWVEGKLSNFQYLMLVNTFSGRTYNDLSQYFVFPWVISNYYSQQIDFKQEQEQNTFRNFKLPIGAISRKPEQIIKEYQEREIYLKDENYQHKYHYSNIQTVLNYLIRLKSYKLIEHSDWLFFSINQQWENSIKYDNKELIPEFYYMPQFLRNINYLSFETLQQQSSIPDVVLPKWVKTQTAEEFVYRMRQALESDQVSNQLNSWIDLIFGINNNGYNAKENMNLFHYLTYEQNLQKILNQNYNHQTIRSYLTKLYYLGQTPKQLFQKAHQKRMYSLQLFTNQIPFFGDNPNKINKGIVFQQKKIKNQLNKSQILGFYPYSKKLNYILQADDEKYNNLTLIKAKNQEDQEYYYQQVYLKQEKKLPEIKIDGCNPQNLFAFIYEQEYNFGDYYDSQFYSIYGEKQNYNLYFCLVGFLDKSVKIYDLRNKMKELDIDISLKNVKRTSCVRYHAVSNILAIGSLDGLLQLFELQFRPQMQAKELFTKQLKNGILCIDLTDFLILTVDYKNIANLLTLEGNLLHTIYLDSQCQIQMYFLVFKRVNSQICIYTINGQQYLKTMNLLNRVTKNIMFTTPFSSKFLLYTLNQNIEENLSNFVPIIYIFDIFDLKLQQQQLGSLNYEQILFKQVKLRGSQISVLHISFDRYQIQKEYQIKHIYLIAIDNQILYLMDEKYDYRLILRQKLKEGGLSII